MQPMFVDSHARIDSEAGRLRTAPALAWGSPDLDDLSARAVGPLVAYVTACAHALGASAPGSAEERLLLERLARDIDLVQAALRSLIDLGCGDEVLVLGAALTRFWQRTHRHHDALAFFHGVELQACALDSRNQATISESAAVLYRDLGDSFSAREELHRALVGYDTLGDCESVARCLFLMSACLSEQGDWEGAHELMAPALDEIRAVGRPREIARSLHQQGWDDLQAGRLILAGQSFAQAAERWKALGDWEQHTRCLVSRGALAVRMGAIDAARQWFGMAATQARELDHLSLLAEVLADQSSTARLAGDNVAALDFLSECFAIYCQIGPRSRLPEAMEAGGSLSLRCKRYALAIRFFGAAQQLRNDSGTRSFAPWSGRIEVWVAELEEISGTPVVPAVGSCADELIESAVEWVAALRSGDGHGSGTLTDRECDVLRVLVLGMTENYLRPSNARRPG